MIEMTLILILLQTMVFSKGDHFKIVTPTVDVYITRYAATILMHMELIQDVKQGLSMIRYINTNPEEFKKQKPLLPFTFAFLQCIGGFIAELMNLFMSATRTRVDLIITFFVAFHVLAAIDSIYLESICDMELIELVEHNNMLHFKRKPKISNI